MYYYLEAMTDDEIADFEINNIEHREQLYCELKKEFDGFGELTKASIIEALEHIYLEEDLDKYWRCVIPHAVPLDDVLDKRDYMRGLFVRLAEREPMASGKVSAEVKLCDQYSPDLNVRH
ncbi:hypothetical protein P5705_09935 [Pseudomonas entomophila]|uniref:hypothetical protein n=1 Tax=Pseudomonas entomophila TaxID=312306 RepID=UPI002405BB57|nr:hypothetical protein [Pseudomonas entomophila]MDF9617962.1 hypothetical protein [Pseudomonas entomophila]